MYLNGWLKHPLSRLCAERPLRNCRQRVVDACPRPSVCANRATCSACSSHGPMMCRKDPQYLVNVVLGFLLGAVSLQAITNEVTAVPPGKYRIQKLKASSAVFSTANDPTPGSAMVGLSYTTLQIAIYHCCVSPHELLRAEWAYRIGGRRTRRPDARPELLDPLGVHRVPDSRRAWGAGRHVAQVSSARSGYKRIAHALGWHAVRRVLWAMCRTHARKSQ